MLRENYVSTAYFIVNSTAQALVAELMEVILAVQVAPPLGEADLFHCGTPLKDVRNDVAKTQILLPIV